MTRGPEKTGHRLHLDPDSNHFTSCATSALIPPTHDETPSSFTRHGSALGTDPSGPLGCPDAADGGLVLTTDELAALGVKGVDGFADGDLAYGYCFHKHNQRNRVLWTVERVIAKPATAKALPIDTEATFSYSLSFFMVCLA